MDKKSMGKMPKMSMKKSGMPKGGMVMQMHTSDMDKMHKTRMGK